jgi:hypothetical protein
MEDRPAEMEHRNTAPVNLLSAENEKRGTESKSVPLFFSNPDLLVPLPLPLSRLLFALSIYDSLFTIHESRCLPFAVQRLIMLPPSLHN